ncbi:MAG TPA: 30S ribosomal protein S12 methylthiotransferase RimO [Campylobacterales bacterium]|nr:30S ribosomal protein S12 methylthiotransferase RimO [Campylobacterales bacterium]
MSKKLHLVSLGCTKNLIDSEVMLGRLQEYEIVNEGTDADVIIVNTCGFIDAAKEESIQTILNLHEERKEDSLLVMSGCLSERYKEELQKDLKEVDIFTGVGDYDRIDELIKLKQNRFSPKSYLIKNEERVITGSNYHAYIKLSEGCNQQCSFCAIPQFKGKLQSRALDSVVEEVTKLVSKGFYDFSFISQDSSSYLRDFEIKDGLIELISAIEKIEGITSARILYLYPSTLSDAVLEKIIDSKIFHNYFDMPIQHISDNLLRIMRRGSGTDVIKHQLAIMRNAPDSFVRTSIIAGHPGEREKDFEELVEFLKEFHFDRINVFAYSDEEGTKAKTMEDKIPLEVVEKRIAILNEIIEEQTIESLQKEIGKEIEIIAQGESSEHEYFVAAKKAIWAEDIDGEILINDNELEGEIEFGKSYIALIEEIAGDKLVGKIIRES